MDLRVKSVKPAGARVAVIPYEPYADSAIEIAGRDKYTHMSTIFAIGAGCELPWEVGMIVCCKTRHNLQATMQVPGRKVRVNALIIEEADILCVVEIDTDGMRIARDATGPSVSPASDGPVNKSGSL